MWAAIQLATTCAIVASTGRASMELLVFVCVNNHFSSDSRVQWSCTEDLLLRRKLWPTSWGQSSKGAPTSGCLHARQSTVDAGFCLVSFSVTGF